MINENIEISKDGVKISYLRYLSDSAIGLLVFMYFIIVHYGNIINGLKLNSIIIGTEEKIAIIFVGFLLSLPIGLAINALSWYFFGTTLYYLSFIWAETGLFFDRASKIDGNYDNSKTLFKYSRNTFYLGAYYLSGLYDTYGLNVPDINHIRGVKRFIRSVSFFLVILAIYHRQYSLYALLIALILIIIVSLLDLETILRNYKYGYYLLLPYIEKISEIDAELKISEGKIDIKTFKYRIEMIGKLIISKQISNTIKN